MGRLEIFKIAFVLVVVACSFSPAATFIVDQSGAGQFTEIQPAINAARDGDTVLVRVGEYEIREPVTFGGKSITVTAEDGPERTTIRKSGTPSGPDSPSTWVANSVVVFENAEDRGAVLEGFTVTGGLIGVYCFLSSPTVANCRISRNSAGLSREYFWAAGVLCVESSSPDLTDCTISGNYRFGLACDRGSGPTLGDCEISGNLGLSAVTSSGVYCSSSSSATLTSCTISGNAGQGIGCLDSSPTLTYCTISGNGDSGVTCGGTLVTGGSSPTLTHCTISGNRWGLVSRESSSPSLRSCIVWDNLAGSGSIGGASVVAYSCIEGGWRGIGNIDDDPLFCRWDRNEVYVDEGNPQPGDGTQANPYSDLASALDYSYALRTGSPCLGTGEGGANMGADPGKCERAGETTRLVRVAPGTYSLRAGLTHNVSIDGRGEDETVLEGEVFGLRTGAFLANLTVTLGYNGISVGVRERAESPEIRHCKISGNSFVGVFCAPGSAPTLTSCTISRNRGGGVLCSRASPTLSECTISENGMGGPVSGTPAVTVWEGSSPTLLNCIVWDNPGGSFSVSAGAFPQVSFSCIECPTVWPGIGNINDDPRFCGWDRREVYVDEGNPGPGDGSAGNPFSDLASALEYSFELSIDSPCLGTGEGGANMGADTGRCERAGEATRLVRVAPGTYSIYRLCLVHHVSLQGAGEEETVLEGGVWGLRTGAVLSDLTVTKGRIGTVEAPEFHRCTFTEYSATFVGPNSSPTFTNCTITGTFSDHGFSFFEGVTPTLTNCLIAGKRLRSLSGSSPTLTNCTISGNGDDVALLCSDASATLTNCIVWGNTGGSIRLEGRSSVTATYSTIEGGWRGMGNIARDPLFVDFAIDPGDYHLQPGSPCIDAGTPESAPAIDIEGNPRPCGAAVDMGAYEFGECRPQAFFKRGDTNADGTGNLSDAVFVLSYLFTGGPAPNCLKSADSDDTGVLDLTDPVYLLNHLFLGGRQPPEPFAECGGDLTADGLSCNSYGPCG